MSATHPPSFYEVHHNLEVATFDWRRRLLGRPVANLLDRAVEQRAERDGLVFILETPEDLEGKAMIINTAGRKVGAPRRNTINHKVIFGLEGAGMVSLGRSTLSMVTHGSETVIPPDTNHFVAPLSAGMVYASVLLPGETEEDIEYIDTAEPPDDFNVSFFESAQAGRISNLVPAPQDV